MDFVFPYLIQFLRQYSTSVDLLMADRKVCGSHLHSCAAADCCSVMSVCMLCCPSC